jgi:hypothetical protein
MIGNVVISKIRALMYVVLRKEKESDRKSEPYRELLGTTECITL